MSSLDREFTRVYEEYLRRVDSVKVFSEEIVNLWAELGTPQAQTETSIIKYYRDAPEQLGLHEDDINRLQTRRDRLIEEKRGRERKLKELKTAIQGLWDRLVVDEPDRKRFLAGNRGCGLRAINEFEAELDRLNELKRQNLHLFVEDARYKLQELWDGLYFSEEEMLDFAPAFSDVYSDALLSAHEGEIARLEVLKEQRAPTLQLIDKHRSLIKDRDELAASSQDASRLLARPTKGEKRDPTRLLREEKMRKRIAKDLPKVEAEIEKSLEQWEDEYGRPFLVHGIRYLDELAANATKNLPPRSKTPFVAVSSTRPTKVAPSIPSSRAGSVVRALPPPRSGAKSPTGTLRRNLLASSVSYTGGRTPSKIPARVPLGHMQYGSNSPERCAVPSGCAYDTSTMRKMGPPVKAPPPKMRDLFARPTTTPINSYHLENVRCASSASSETGSVRQVTPEDVYNYRERVPNSTSSAIRSEQNTPQNYRDIQASSQYDTQYKQQGRCNTTTDTRQISAASASTAGASGSENWETFDDASEPEVDASDVYYAKVRATKASKRFTPEGGYTPPHGGQGKKFKNMYSGASQTDTVIKQDAESLVPTGSDAGWTDEDAL